MKALLKTKREEGIWMGEVPMPEMGPNDVLIRVHKSAICGTDVHIYNWDDWAQKTIPVPMVVGHEYYGVIEQVGAEVEGYKPGDRVAHPNSRRAELACPELAELLPDRASRISPAHQGIHPAGIFFHHTPVEANGACSLPRG